MRVLTWIYIVLLGGGGLMALFGPHAANNLLVRIIVGGAMIPPAVLLYLHQRDLAEARKWLDAAREWERPNL